MSNRVPEERKGFHQIDPTFRFDICDREGGMRCDLLDGLRSSIAIFWYDEEPSLRRCIGNSDCDIRVLGFKNSEIFTEPVFLLIQTVWRMEIHERDTEIGCDREDLIDLFSANTTLGSSYTEDIHPRDPYEAIDITRIAGIVLIEINREIDTIIFSLFREDKYLVKSIARERCRGEEKQMNKKLTVKSEEWLMKLKISLSEHTPFFDNFQILLFISYTSDTIFAKSNSFAIENFLDDFLIIAQCGISTLELEEDNLSESPLGEPIKDEIVASLPDEDHILRCVWEVWKSRKYFLIEFSKNLILWSSHCWFAYILCFEKSWYPHECHPDEQSKYESDDEGSEVHCCLLFVIFSILFDIF